MKFPSSHIEELVLDNKASAMAAGEVADWFGTAESEQWLIRQMDEDFNRIERGDIPPVENIPGLEILNGIKSAINIKRRRRRWMIAAAILVPCAILTGFWADISNRLGGNMFSAVDNETIETAPGETVNIVFQDGSKVHLGPDSRIVYPRRFGISSRDVFLSGEAYLEVASAHGRPFRVHLGDADINVLGTMFNVKAYDDSPEISVILDRGRVTFSDFKTEYRMEPADKLVYDRITRQRKISRVNDDHGTLWRQGVTVFDKAPLNEVISTLKHNYGVQTVVTSQEAYKYYYTLRTNKLPLKDFLWELERIGPVTFTLRNDTIHINSRPLKLAK